MKKIVLPLLFMPFAALAQTYAPVAKVYSEHHYAVQNDLNYKDQAQPQATTPIKNGGIRPESGLANYPYNPTQIGTTTYDLQTNGSLAKRLQLYSGGKLSAVWIRADLPKDPNFTTRYSGYNSFDGTNWIIGQTNFTPIEFERSGWPNINLLTDKSGKTSEILTSHYAAAGVASYAGGIYWYRNNAIGNKDSFKKVIDVSNGRDSTRGLLWPRMATSGDRVYLIGTYQDFNGGIHQAGVNNPIVYFCYNTTTGKWLTNNKVLPGYDSTRYLWGAADEYSIDARDNFVAILIGGITNDLALWKSTDSGKSFTKTVIQSFKYAPYNYKIDPSFDDTLVSNDGSGTVSLSSDGVAHVTFSPTDALNPTSGDSGVNYLGTNRGIMYWNDRDQKQILVGGAIDYDRDSAINITSANLTATSAGYSGHNFCSFSNTAVDAQGHIYVVYSCPHEMDVDPNFSWAYRHVYCSVFDGSKWHKPQDITQTWGLENAYPTVARDADSKLHLMTMRDDVPGIFNPGSTGGSQSITLDTIMYAGISTSDLLNDKVGLRNDGINDKHINNLFRTSDIYPNPANSSLTVGISMKRSSSVSISIIDVLGQEVQSQNFATVPAGTNNINLDVNKLPSGIYMCNITAGGFTSSQRIVISR